MAQHRRVEPRGIVGTGMATDAERIQDVEAEHERRMRAWREAPERGFGDVLQEAPAKGALEDEPPEDPRKRRARAPDATGADAGAPSAPAPVPEIAAPAAPAKAALPKVPPDPRERMLRARLAQSLADPRPATSGETPPTGNHARKPR